MTKAEIIAEIKSQFVKLEILAIDMEFAEGYDKIIKLFKERKEIELIINQLLETHIN